MVVNVRTLRSSTKEILRKIERGEEVLISNRGRTCAKIVPLREEAGSARLSLAGLWKENRKVADPKDFIRRLREPRHAR